MLVFINNAGLPLVAETRLALELRQFLHDLVRVEQNRSPDFVKGNDFLSHPVFNRSSRTADKHRHVFFNQQLFHSIFPDTKQDSARYN